MLYSIPKINSNEWLSLDSLPGEEWVILDSISPYLLVSNYGRVKRLEMFIESWNGFRMTRVRRREKILLCIVNGHNYLSVSFCQKKYYIHRLVALGFIPNPLNLPQIDHINGDKQDNRVENLQWATPTQNRHNPITEKRCEKASIEHGRPIVQLSTNGEFIREWGSITEAANNLGCSIGSISRVLSGKAKTIHEHRFVYKDKYDPSQDYSVVYRINTAKSKRIINQYGYVELQDGHALRYFGTEKDVAKYYGVEVYNFKSNYKRLRNGKPVGVRKKFKFPLTLIRIKDLSPDLRGTIIDEAKALIA